MSNIQLMNEELKRLHELLTLQASDKEMRDKVLDLIQKLHETLFYLKLFIPGPDFDKDGSDGWSIR